MAMTTLRLHQLLFDFLSLQAGSSKVKMLGHEINILRQVNHAHIIHLQEVYDTAKVSVTVKESLIKRVGYVYCMWHIIISYDCVSPHKLYW